MRLTRYWMTGCMAMVLLAAGRWPELRDREEASAQGHGWITLTSKYSVDETVQKIEKSARKRGLAVMAKVVPDRLNGDVLVPAPATVLVLGDHGGQTPMIQADADATPDLPMKLLVAQQPDGSTRVMFHDGLALMQDDDLPHEFRDPMTMLPQVVDAAVG
ncbi:MAG: DUF302 domain-containing protein [Burkholderiales bacterium]|nr:DUF302 domain-containing protein [Burkholderiales bacterium]